MMSYATNTKFMVFLFNFNTNSMLSYVTNVKFMVLLLILSTNS